MSSGEHDTILGAILGVLLFREGEGIGIIGTIIIGVIVYLVLFGGSSQPITPPRVESESAVEAAHIPAGFENNKAPRLSLNKGQRILKIVSL